MARKPRANLRRVPIQLELKASEAPVSSILRYLEAHAPVLAIALILIASARIAATYFVYSHTSDEPAHIASGLEWLAKGVYTWEPQHPPLARVSAAVGPYLVGARPQNTPRGDIYAITHEGVGILFQGNHYDLTLLLARLGVLPFFWAACMAVYWWGLRCFDRATAVIALALFSFLPPVLAHAGLATTDMALTAFLTAAFVAACVWWARPTPRNGVIFGACIGLALLSKFSSLAYFPAAIGLALAGFYLTARPGSQELRAGIRPRVPSLGLALLTACALIWTLYRFSFGPTVLGISLPAPEFYAGLEQVMRHNSQGHPEYLFGKTTLTGVWYYFPLVLAIKTPIGFLFLLGGGVALAVRNRARFPYGWLPLAFSAGILAVALFSHINIGVRHILPIYAGFALLAALSVVRLLEMVPTAKWAGAGLGVLILWFAGASLLAHPDYLPYFNEFAADHPERIEVDSDLDWGQDMKRLAKRLNQEGATGVSMLPFLRELPPGAFGLPPMQTRIDVLNPMPGWNAVSLTILKETRMGLLAHPEYSPWPDRIATPSEHIGKGILLWYSPPSPQ